MSDKKKPINNDQPKQDKQKNLNESAERQRSQDFNRAGNAKNNSGSGKIQYISKPKISSEDTNNDKKK